MQFFFISLCYFCFFFVICFGGLRIEATHSVWWKSTVIYQLFIPSFKDSNNDGIGDIKGATQSLPYLKDLGVGTIWLSSFHKAQTPLLDFAVSDFKSILPQYGTLADFEDFMAECNALGLHVIMDFIPNHSSTVHEWFKKSAKREAPYTDYYIWKPSSSNNKSAPLPPCNWASAAEGAAWTLDKDRGEYYYHAFFDSTADFNLRNANVQKEMKEILKFWMTLGIEGFVIETISYLFEDEKCLDEPVIDKNKKSPNETHPYTMNQKENLALLKEWRQYIDNFPSPNSKPRFLMVRQEPFEELKTEYYGTQTEPGAHIVMNPALVRPVDTLYSLDLDQVIGQSLKHMILNNPPLWINWAVGGSRDKRVATRLRSELVDAANMLLMMLPGTPITYYGEEIGMQSYTKIPKSYRNNEFFAGERTPFQWNDHPNAGFSESHATDTWLPVNADYYTVNVENEKENPKSHLNVYKRMVKLRNQPEMQNSEISTFVMSYNIFVLIRETSADKKYILIMNFCDISPCINFKQNILDIKDPYLVVHTASENSEYNINDQVNIENCFMMRPKSALLLTSSGNSVLRITFGITFFLIFLIFQLV